MAAWKEEDIKKIRQKLWRSVDMLYVKGWLIGLVVAEVLFPLIVLLKGGYSDDFWKVTLIIGAITAVPFLLFCLWRTVKIFRRAEGYTFCKAQLRNPHYNYLHKTMAFTVLVETPDGRKIVTETRAIFHTHGFIPPVMENYTGRTVTVAYNEDTESVVVVG